MGDVTIKVSAHNIREIKSIFDLLRIIVNVFYVYLFHRSYGGIVMSGKRVFKQVFILISLFFISSQIFAQYNEIVGWGRDNFGQISDIPAGTDYAAIASKGEHNLVLRTDGSLAAWGYDLSGQCNVPAGNDFVSIATGNFHSLAVRSDGSIEAWGQDIYNQVSNAPTTGNFVAVSGGYHHSLALRENGSLVGWGANSYGQCNVPAGTDFVAVEAGGFHSIALRENGTIVAWGRNWHNVLNVPTGNDFVAISAGYYQNVALRDNGTLVVWGSNDYGQISDAPTTSDFIAVSTAISHCLALRDNGTIAAWGRDNYFQVSDAPTGTGHTAVAAGRTHSVALLMADPPIEFTLTIGFEGEGTTNPLPGDHIYDTGLDVLITAIPDDEWIFDRWVINGTEVFENPYTVTMNSNITAIAHFVPEPPPEYTLTIEVVGNGETMPEPGNYIHEEGTEVDISAQQIHPEWPFSHWMIDGTEFTESTITVTILSDITVTAYFMLLPPPSNLTATAGDGIVLLEWDYPDMLPDFMGYNVVRNEEIINMDLVLDPVFEDTDVENGVTYTYYVTAVYPNGASLGSNTVEVTPEELFLPPPTNLDYQTIEFGTVLFTWEMPDFIELDINFLGYNFYQDDELINPEPLQETEFIISDLPAGVTITFYVTAVYEEGESEPSNIVEFLLQNADENTISTETKLRVNYPNPFNPETTISFIVADPGQVVIEIFNSRGWRIKTLTDQHYASGQYQIIWYGKDNNRQQVGSGIYFYRMTAGDYSETKKMIMIK